MNNLAFAVGPSAITVFESRHLSPNELAARLQLVRKHLGDGAMRALIERPISDQGSAITIADRTSVLGAVQDVPGFGVVTKAIRSYPHASLLEPVGEWLQLMTAAVLRPDLPTLAFETILAGAPKDVVVAAQSLNIECKAFSASPILDRIVKNQAVLFDKLAPRLPNGNWAITIDREWNERRNLDDAFAFMSHAIDTGLPLADTGPGPIRCRTSNHVMEPAGGFVGGIFGTAQPTAGMEVPFFAGVNGGVSVFIQGPLLDQVLRYTSVLAEKHHQMVEGWCNLLALDVEQFTGDRTELPNRLSEALNMETRSSISGVLLVSRATSPSGTIFSPTVVLNANALVPVPPALLEILVLQRSLV